MTAPAERREFMGVSAQYNAIEALLLKGFSQPVWPEAEFSEIAGVVHGFQRENNALYDRYCRHLGAPRQVADWRSIPPAPQSLFKRYPLRSFPAAETEATFLTSGTTGETRGAHHFRSLRLYEAALLGGADRAGLPRLPQLILIAPGHAAPQSSLSHMMTTLESRAPRQDYFMQANGELQTAALTSAVRRHAGSGEPALLLGTALAFLHWFDRLGQERLSLPPGSAAFETGGYKGSRRHLAKSDLYALFEDCLGLPPDRIWNEYGMTELSSQFYSRGIGRAHLGPPWVRTRIIDPATGNEAADGEPGVLQIFDLANLGSVLAIETRDIARRHGDGFELLGRDPGALPRGCSRSADELLSHA